MVEKKEKSKVVYERLVRERGFEATKFTDNGRSNYALKKSYRTKDGEWKSELIHVFPGEVESLAVAVNAVRADWLKFRTPEVKP